MNQLLSLPLLFAVATLWFIVALFRAMRPNGYGASQTVARQVLFAVFLVYVVLLIEATIMPIEIGGPRERGGFNAVPLRESIIMVTVGLDYGMSYAIRNILGNLVLLAPVGLLAPALWTRFRSWKTVLLLGLSISVSIELLQLVVSSYRTTDIDDVILNVTGTAVGYLCYKLALRLPIPGRFMHGRRSDGVAR